MGFINDLNECTDPTSGDYLIIADASASASDRDRRVNVSRFATVANQNTFTVPQTFAPASTSANGVVVNMPTSTTAYALLVQLNGVDRFRAIAAAAENTFQIANVDSGSVAGPRLLINRNNNASTPSAGHATLQALTGTSYSIWPDASGVLRISNSQPTSASDTGGAVVGAQTSMAEAKNIEDELSGINEVIARVKMGAMAVRRFTYRNKAFNRERFEGVITDLAPAFGMDRDESHPQGKSLNIVQIIGDLLRVTDDLIGRVEALEAT